MIKFKYSQAMNLIGKYWKEHSALDESTLYYIDAFLGWLYDENYIIAENEDEPETD